MEIMQVRLESSDGSGLVQEGAVPKDMCVPIVVIWKGKHYVFDRTLARRNVQTAEQITHNGHLPPTIIQVYRERVSVELSMDTEGKPL